MTQLVVPDRPEYRVVLGLDPANLTGVALALVPPGSREIDPGRLHLDLWDLEPGRYDSDVIRFVRLRHLLAAARPSFVALETPVGAFGGGDRAAGKNRYARDLLAQLVATVSTWCEEAGVPCDGIPVATIKKRAAGRGNAGKPEIIRAANAQYGVGLDPDSERDSNKADALFALVVGLESHGLGLA